MLLPLKRACLLTVINNGKQFVSDVINEDRSRESYNG